MHRHITVFMILIVPAIKFKLHTHITVFMILIIPAIKFILEPVAMGGARVAGGGH